MKIKILKYVLLIFSFLIGTGNTFDNTRNQASNQINTCLSCHREMEIMPEDFSENDVHQHAEISCVGCHGGDPSNEDQEIAMSKSKNFIGIPAKNEIPRFCGRCHSDIDYMRKYQPRIATDQVDQYYHSVHGKQLAKGDKNVATCTSCHSVHSILPVKDPRSTVYPANIPQTCNHCHGDQKLMDQYSLKHNQFSDYIKSVHGVALLENKDISAPACNDCHGNHGASPPEVESISQVCGTCHVSNMEYFNKSKMGDAFYELGYHGCEQCHGNHEIKKPGDEMIGTTAESICMDCHEEGDSGYKAAGEISNLLREVSGLFDTAKNNLLEIQTKGMNDIEINYLLQDARQSLIQLRTMVHTFDVVKIQEKSAAGKDLAEKAIQLANIEREEFYNRRLGFGISAFAFVLIAIALFFKIRQSNSEIADKQNSES